MRTSCNLLFSTCVSACPAISSRESPKKEKWGKNNVFTNNVEAPSYMVNLPENGKLKERIFEGLRPILEEWSGVSRGVAGAVLCVASLGWWGGGAMPQALVPHLPSCWHHRWRHPAHQCKAELSLDWAVSI